MSFINILLEIGVYKNKNGNALICDNTVYTYLQLLDKIKRMAGIFQNYNIDKGDKVIIVSKNPLQFSITLLTILYMDAIPIPLYSNTGKNKLVGIVEYYDVNHIIYIGDENVQLQYEYQRYNDGHIYRIYNCMKEKDLSLNKVKLILFTSGTTNIPKAVMLSEENIYSNIVAISEYLKLNCADNILLVKDLSHSSSIIGELFVGLINGSSVILSTRLPLSSTILKLIEQQKISVFFAVPTLLKGIIANNLISNYNLSSLRIINFYGSSMNYKDIEKLIDVFPYANVIYSYGQTEASPRVTYIEKKDLLNHKGSSGKPIKDVNVSIMNARGKTAKYYELGEILVSGPNVMLGYYKNKMKTINVIKDGILYTGDIGYLDEDCYLYVTGRKDNMIISSGKNIYPEEIEGVLCTYKDIIETLVKAKEKEDGTCELTAYVVLKDNAVLDKDKLFEYCKDNLDLYKIPKEITIVDSFEKTASGKIVRR